jgi:hypothetical protein
MVNYNKAVFCSPEVAVMFWSLSFQLLPDEVIIADSTRQAIHGFQPTYSVYLTNKRAVFRFEGVKSTVVQSFTYSEITDARLAKRLLINYLCLHASGRKFYLHTTAPAYWSTKIIEVKKRLLSPQAAGASAGQLDEKKLRELGDMLVALRTYDILSDHEVEQKTKKLKALRF